MESPFWAMLACILLTMGAVTDATTTQEIYWQSVLPSTIMPKFIKDQLQQDLKGMQWDINPSPLANMHDMFKGGINLENIVYIGDISSHITNDPTSLLFFLEKDLYPGKEIIMKLSRTETKAFLLPRQVADSIPFSSTKLEDIFNQFSIHPESPEAEGVKMAIKMCELQALKGEDKYCATSLESMIDFVTLKLGKDVMVMRTEVDKEETPQQVYSVGLGIQKFDGVDKPMACHAMTYMYTVLYCHSIESTTAYMVPLVGADGTKVKALAFCHRDTSTWNPEHAVFARLNVKPGMDPICHFFLVETIVWLPK